MIIPGIIVLVLISGYKKKIDMYDSFNTGVVKSFKMIKTLFPTFLSMIFAINIFINSGFLELLFKLLNPIISIIKIPIEILPIALMRPISSGASLAYLTNIFERFGPDSLIGFLSSVIQGCTDTTLYVVSLYFGYIGIKKIRYSLFAGFLADLIGITASIIVVKLLFN